MKKNFFETSYYDVYCAAFVREGEFFKSFNK